MKKFKLLLIFIFPLTVLSQPTTLSSLQSQIDGLENQKNRKLSETLASEAQLAQASEQRQTTLARALEIGAIIPTLDKRKIEKLKEISKEIESELEATKIPLEEQIRITHYRDQNKYRGYLKCLRRNLDSGSDIFNKKIETCRPRRAQDFTGSASFMQKLQKASELLSIDEQKLRREYNTATNKVSSLDSKINSLKHLSYDSRKELEQLELQIDDLQVKFKREEFMAINKDFYNCNSKTPTIDLENETLHAQTSKKGPFYNIPRDHQDGVGTCYANTAKNLLLGLSDGKMNASFLEMALQYKSKFSNGQAFDLDGGHSCEVLKIVEDIGYCPKGFSPIESGDETQRIGGLFKDNTSLYGHAQVIEMVKRFMDGKALLEKNTDSCSISMVKNSKKMIEAMKADADIKLPYPTINNFVLDKNKMLGFYFWSYKNKVTNPISEEEYLNDYNRVQNEFSKSYLEAAIGEESEAKLRKRFDDTYGQFFRKYGFEDKLKVPHLASRLDSFLRKGYDQDFRKAAIKTSMFYKEFFSESNDTVNLSDSTCLKDNSLFTTFISGLNEIANMFRATGGDTDKLFDNEGNFISSHDLMTLAVAPKCLNTSNRKKLDLPYQCKLVTTNRALTVEREISNKRDLILTSLLEGLPVGNTHPQPGGSHINTIVGFRYNSSIDKCEYKIRESQSATSFWTSEKDILKNNTNFTFVEKK